MINWLTNAIGTGAYLEVSKIKGDFNLVDVTSLVDKDGNTNKAIDEKIEEALNVLRKNEKVVICCDYGMSRSNSIAVGVIAKYEKIPFSEALVLVQNKVAEQGMKLEVLDAVYRAYNSVSGKSIQGKENAESILITGASGFIGRKVLQDLNPSFLVKGLSSKDADLVHNPIVLDILAKENGITTLIHLANPRIYTVNVAMGDSLVMLKNVLEVCRLNNIRLIYVSSWETYSGYRADELIADEALPLFPKGSYGESKWMSEQLIGHYHKIYGLKNNILRSSPIYGENSDRPKFIYNFIEKAKSNKAIFTHKYLNGDPKLDLLYVDDFVSALKKIISFKEVKDFNLGSGRLISTWEIAEMIVKLTGSKSVVGRKSIDSFYSNIRIDSTRAKNLLGWEPDFTLETALKKLLLH